MMTHDELLAKVESLDGTLIFYDGRPTIENVGKGDKVNGALRAVVELHKPFDFTMGGEPYLGCNCGQEYPCPTIQAIEKELA